MAMHCPQCLTEYRDGFVECVDCHVPLAFGLPPEESASEGYTLNGRRLELPLDVVTVPETSDGFAITLAKASLEDAGIDYVVLGDDPRHIPGFDPTPICRRTCAIQVTRECEAEARALMEPLQNPEAATDAEMKSAEQRDE